MKHGTCMKPIYMTAIALAVYSLPVQSDAGKPLTQEDLSIVDMTASIRDRPSAVLPDLSGLFGGKGSRKQKHKTGDELIDNPPGWLLDAAGAKPTDKKEHVVIFVSRGMPLADLKDVVAQAAGRDDVRVVFRGIDENENIKDFFLFIRTLLNEAKVKEPPEIDIDPMIFKKHNVVAVPQIFLMNGDKVLAYARGVYGVEWIHEQYDKNGRAGDLGRYGEMDEITEIDLVELMKSRLSKIDMEQIRKKAISRFWERTKFTQLTTATVDRELKLDPSIVVSSDIRSPEGDIIAAAGTKLNPLDIMPFTTRLVVFDPLNKKELDVVDRIIEDTPRTSRVQLLVTRLSRESGWEDKENIEARFGHPVYLLTDDVRARFNLMHTPSLVYASNRYFYVKEFAVSSAEGETSN